MSLIAIEYSAVTMKKSGYGRRFRVLLGTIALASLTNLIVFGEAPPRLPIRPPESEAAREAEMKPYEQTLRDTSVSFRMTPIPSGEFLMGAVATDQEVDKSLDASPPHRVKLAAFWMGICEVTWDEFNAYRLHEDRRVRQLSQISADDDDRRADAVTRPDREYSDPCGPSDRKSVV